MESDNENGGGTCAGTKKTGGKRHADDSRMDGQIKRSVLEDISNSLNSQENEEEQAAAFAQKPKELQSPVGDNNDLDQIEDEMTDDLDMPSLLQVSDEEQPESESEPEPEPEFLQASDEQQLESESESETEPGPEFLQASDEQQSESQSDPESEVETEPEPSPSNQVALTQLLPMGWDDLERDEEPLQAWPYAMDLFNYLKDCEASFVIDDYMPRQVHLTPWSRTELINWMVSVQHRYKGFNETLFLAVKIVDLFLCRKVIEESQLQLLGSTALYIAYKYEEKVSLRIAELLDTCDKEEDFYIEDLLEMELETLKIINYSLGIPISYRFLRRYARSADVPVSTWMLGRYILELALLDYETIGNSDSQMASAALFIALRMIGEAEELDEHTWNESLVLYSGYELKEFAKIVPALNAGLHRTEWSYIGDVQMKYSQLLLHEVTELPLLTNQQLFRHNPDLYEANVA